MKIQSIFVLLGIIILTVITIIGGVKSCSKETSPTKTGQVVTQPKNIVTEMRKKLGPRWKKIKMTQGRWYGPYSVRGGSNWKIGQGEIYTKAKGKIYKDGPGVYISLSNVKKIFFLSKKGKGVVFLKY